jgi:hypothetical protein
MDPVMSFVSAPTRLVDARTSFVDAPTSLMDRVMSFVSAPTRLVDARATIAGARADFVVGADLEGEPEWGPGPRRPRADRVSELRWRAT